MQLESEFLAQKSTQALTNRLSVLERAAIRVIMVRTREPLRCAATIEAYGKAESRPVMVWSITRGWCSDYSLNPIEPSNPDGVSDPMAALLKIGSDTRQEGIWVMLHPHPFLSKHPGMIQLVKEYAAAFTGLGKTLILIVPVGFSPPPEIEDDVPILDFTTPTLSEHDASIKAIIESIRDPRNRPKFSTEEIQRLTAAGTGMTKAEYEAALARALVENRAKLPNVPCESLVASVLLAKTEVVKRSEVLELMKPETMASVGGLGNLKRWVALRRRCFGDEARAFGITPPRGIALIGPPGTGKSLAAKAIASELGLPLVRFDVSRVFSSLVGSSEERVRSALKMIASMAPVVVMLDEIDKVFQRDSGGDSGVSMRVLGAVLTEMQEQTAPVFWVATANRVRNLPSEFLRRGRLDEVFSVTVPDADERLEILSIHLKKRGHDPNAIPDLWEAVSVSEGFVPAELEAAVKDALIEAFAEGGKVTGKLIAKQLEGMVPLSQAFAEDFLAMEQWAKHNARPAGGKTTAAVNAPQTRKITRISRSAIN